MAVRTAFCRACACLGDPGAPFPEGVDPDLKVKLARDLGLTPLDYKYREILRESRAHHPVAR